MHTVENILGNFYVPARCQVLDNQPTYLFHGTSVKRKKSILNIGMSSTSYWGTQEVAEYFARNTPGRPLIFRVPIAFLSRKAPAFRLRMKDYCKLIISCYF